MSLIAPDRVLVAGAFQWSRQTRLLPWGPPGAERATFRDGWLHWSAAKWNPLQVFDGHIQNLRNTSMAPPATFGTVSFIFPPWTRQHLKKPKTKHLLI